jgi:hypothetical protein
MKGNESHFAFMCFHLFAFIFVEFAAELYSRPQARSVGTIGGRLAFPSDLEAGGLECAPYTWL